MYKMIKIFHQSPNHDDSRRASTSNDTNRKSATGVNYVITKKKTSFEIISSQVVSNKLPTNYQGSMLEVLKNVVKRSRIEQEDEETRVFCSGKIQKK